MHLNTTIEMLPYFNAAEHLPYSKSAQLYIQQMTNIESKLSEQEFAYFKEKGCVTVWRHIGLERGLICV